MTAAQYNELCRRLRATRAEIALITGRPLGTVSHWGHAGATAQPVPEEAIDQMRGALMEQAADDAAVALGAAQRK